MIRHCDFLEEKLNIKVIICLLHGDLPALVNRVTDIAHMLPSTIQKREYIQLIKENNVLKTELEKWKNGYKTREVENAALKSEVEKWKRRYITRGFEISLLESRIEKMGAVPKAGRHGETDKKELVKLEIMGD